MSSKTCYRYNVITASRWYKDKSNKNLFLCSKCYSKEYRTAKPEIFKRWKRENREYVNDYNRKYRTAHTTKLSKSVLQAMLIGEEVFKVDGSIRDVVSISKLLKKHDGPDQIREILTTLQRYGNQNEC